MKLKQLKVRPKKILESSPCVVEMGALFECWATSGIDDKHCQAVAKSLQECMAKPVCFPLILVLFFPDFSCFCFHSFHQTYHFFIVCIIKKQGRKTKQQNTINYHLARLSKHL